MRIRIEINGVKSILGAKKGRLVQVVYTFILSKFERRSYDSLRKVSPRDRAESTASPLLPPSITQLSVSTNPPIKSNLNPLEVYYTVILFDLDFSKKLFSAIVSEVCT